MAVMFLSHEKSLKISCWSIASLTAFSSHQDLWCVIIYRPNLASVETSNISTRKKQFSVKFRVGLCCKMQYTPRFWADPSAPLEKSTSSWSWGAYLVRLSQQDSESKASLGYTVKPCLINKTKKQSSTAALLGCAWLVRVEPQGARLIGVLWG